MPPWSILVHLAPTSPVSLVQLPAKVKWGRIWYLQPDTLLTSSDYQLGLFKDLNIKSLNWALLQLQEYLLGLVAGCW